MRKILTAAALLFATVAFSSQAQAAFTQCSLSFKATNVNLAILSGMDGIGYMTCKDAFGHTTKGHVGIAAAGPALGLGICKVKGKMTLVGAGLTWNQALTLFANAELGPVFTPGKSINANVSVGVFNPNVQAGVGTMAYSAGCLKFASLTLGGIMDIEDYKQMKKRQQEKQYEGGR